MFCYGIVTSVCVSVHLKDPECDDRLTFKAVSAYDRAGLAACSLTSAKAFSDSIPSTILRALSFTIWTSFFTMEAAAALTVTSASTCV